ncbi:MAG: LacI family DNA-binding transcriptional regulator [Candidatus Velthaea sp.]
MRGGPVTLLDVAREAGVSLATASRVINGSARKVSEGLRGRVTAAAEALNYVPNAYAQALARSRTSIAGVIVHDIDNPFYAGIVRGVQRIAIEAKQILLICNSDRDPQRELDYLGLMHEHRAATIIIAASGHDDASYAAKLAARLRSFVDGGGRAAVIGRHAVDVPAVVPDNRGGMRSLVSALIAQGHRRFAVITGPRRLTTVEDRLAGVTDALALANLSLDPGLVFDGALTREGGALAAEALYGRKGTTLPTAIVALSDEMAIGALSTLRRRGVRVPHDVSLTGFDDIPSAADLEPPLTTVRIALDQLGERAMRLALDDGSSSQSVPFPAHLVLRASSTALDA